MIDTRRLLMQWEEAEKVNTEKRDLLQRNLVEVKHAAKQVRSHFPAREMTLPFR
jgi:hypothetical protein